MGSPAALAAPLFRYALTAIAMTQAGFTHLSRTSYKLYPTVTTALCTPRTYVRIYTFKRDSRTRRTTAVGHDTHIGGTGRLEWSTTTRAYLSKQQYRSVCSLFNARTCRSINSPCLGLCRFLLVFVIESNRFDKSNVRKRKRRKRDIQPTLTNGGCLSRGKRRLNRMRKGFLRAARSVVRGSW